MFTNDKNLPLSLSVMLAHDEYPVHREGVISVTSLLKPIKQLVLGMRMSKESVGGTQDISSRIASSYGTAVHNSLEAAWCSDRLPETLQSLGYPQSVINKVRVNPDDEDLLDPSIIPIYTEYRTEKEFNGWIISGEFDFVSDGRVRDLKTTGTYTYTAKTNDDKYILQGSMYRWLNPERITDDVMAIDYAFTDWSGLQASIQKDKYPQTRMMEQLFVLMSLEETEEYVSNKLRQVDELRHAEEHMIPPCTDEDLWIQPSKFKYFKKPDAKRATRVYDTHAEALAHYTKDGAIGIVMEHKGEVKACRYCDALPICAQAQRYINSGELKL